LWVAFLVVVTGVVLHEHERRSVTPAYRDATEAWWARRAMYDRDVHGFLYLPPAAVLYTPFARLPGVWGGVTWRWTGMAVLATAAWRLAGLGGGSRGTRFLVITLLTLPALAGSARNGQMNVPMAGLMAHAAVDLAVAHWWRAGLGLALGVALKPTTLPLAMLAAVLYPPTSWRLALFLGALLALPLATADPGYVAAQYRAFVEKIPAAGTPPPGRWQDLTGIGQALGYEVPARVMTPLRLLAAVATLAVAWLARPVRDLALASAAVLALGAGYILLWSPRTEGVTYVILSPVVGLFAAWALEADPRSRAGWLCIAIALVLGVSHLLTPGKWNTWMRPAVTLVFLGWLVPQLVLGRPPAPADPGPREAAR
jgi:hypothetical protein